MEKGRPGLLCEKEGGSTRRNGELEARRLEIAWRRLFFGEPRLLVMGVDFAVLGDDGAFRLDGREGVALWLRLGLTGEVKMANLDGFTYPASWLLLVLDFLVGVEAVGSTFSESSSSKTSGARWRLPVDGVTADLKLEGDARFEMAIQHAFSKTYLRVGLKAIYHSACSSRSGVPGGVRRQSRQRAGA